MRVALILNPGSGSISDPDELIASVRERCDEVTVHEIQAADGAADAGADRIVVAGGDGTLGTAFAVAARAGVPIAVVPAGTANDFAAAFELPESIADALDLATAPDADRTRVWGGFAGDRPFVNVASVGLAVDAAAYAEDFKRYLGPAAYLAGAARAGVAGHPVRATVAHSGRDQAHGRVWQVLVGSTGRFGGGSGLGEADPERPMLTTAWVPAGSRFTLPFRAAGLRSHTIEQQTSVEWWQSERFSVHATHGGRPAAWNLDGERWEPSSATVEFRPLGPVELVVPPGRA